MGPVSNGAVRIDLLYGLVARLSNALSTVVPVLASNGEMYLHPNARRGSAGPSLAYRDYPRVWT